MYELLSKRIKNADGELEVFTYNSFPQAFRNQVFYILEDVLEPHSAYNESLWDIFEEKFCREKGLKGMGYGKLQNGYGKSSIEEYFKDCDDIDFLDAIDYFFYLIDKKIRTIKPEYQYDYDADGAINAAIAELNYRFKQHNLGYEFANSQIITIDSTFLHKTAVKPTLKLLFEEGFEGAEDEIRNVYERRRKGDNKNAILEAGKAFESTMKIICDKQGYFNCLCDFTVHRHIFLFYVNYKRVGRLYLFRPLCLSLKLYYIYPTCTSMHNDIFVIFSFLANKWITICLFS